MKKVICLLLIVTLLLGLSTGISYASTGEEEIKTVIGDYFATKAQSLLNNNIGEAQNLSMYFTKNNKYLGYEIGRIQYLIESNIVSDTNYDAYKFDIEYANIDIKGINAIVEARVITDSMDNKIEVQHKITLEKTSGNWLIVKDEYIDEFKMLFDFNTNFANETEKMKQNYQKDLEKNIKNKDVVPPVNNKAGKNEDEFASIVPGDSTIYLNRTNAVAYARAWTDNTGAFEGTSYNNDQFKYFSYKNDCQNYVSQCLWYGFGGRYSSTHDAPMYSEWWADTSSTSTTWNWTGTSYFYSEITSNYTNNYYGVKGYATTPSNIQIGDYIYVPGHVLFVTKASDTDADGVVEYSELEICAHTSNRKDVKLSSLYGAAAPSDMKFMHIVNVKWNDAMNM